MLPTTVPRTARGPWRGEARGRRRSDVRRLGGVARRSGARPCGPIEDAPARGRGRLATVSDPTEPDRELPTEASAAPTVETLHALLLDLFDDLPDDVEARAGVLAYLVSLSVELRVRAELAIGHLLVTLPDGGGRAARGRAPQARTARGVLGLDRSAAARLRRLAELDPSEIEAMIDGAWSGFPTPIVASGIVRARKPPPS